MVQCLASISNATASCGWLQAVRSVRCAFIATSLNQMVVVEGEFVQWVVRLRGNVLAGCYGDWMPDG